MRAIPSNARLDPAGQATDDDPVSRLAEEMIHRWHTGDRVHVEEFLDRQPDLWHRAELALQLIYEEVCLRHEDCSGSAFTSWDDVDEDVLKRFPQWRQQLEVMLECHRLLEQPIAAPRYPEAGETLAGYSLQRELGRGNAGRVFLASQPALADRPVVVKLISLQGTEHLHLARLQHTHIVPLYAVQDDPGKNLRILCMPYFGGTTLEHLLRELAHLPPAQRGGAQLMAILGSSGVQASGPARQIFARLSYVQAMCWIGVCLAEALQYAHECDLVHLDLKPSNVLIAADGQPMLLDFHLARAPLEAGEQASEGIGGTPAYMPKEQRLALAAIAEGAPIPLPVDRRADIYSLGAILYEALGGKLPLEPGALVPLHLHNSQVTRGLSDIVGKCLAPESSDRYAQASDLAADLRRHLTDQPLLGVRNRSWAERLRKWRRRRPPAERSVLRTWLLLAVVGSALGALAAGALSHWRYLLGDANRGLQEGRKNRHDQRFGEALESLHNGLEHAQGVPFQWDLVRQFQEEIHETELAQAAVQRIQFLDKLHTLAEQVRALYGIESLPARRLAGLDKSCRDFWDKRRLIQQWLEPARSSPEAASDLFDLALFAAELKVRLAPASEKEKARAEAVRDLNEAEELFGPSIVLDQERKRLDPSGHGWALKERVSARPVPLAAQTVWEHCALGRSLLQEGRLQDAGDHLRQALLLQPHGFWPNFYYGLCAHRLGHHADAVAAFSVCIGAAPAVAVSYFNRALVYGAMGLEEQALRDYDQALRLDSSLAVAALNRAMVHYRAKRFAQAEADLQQALKLGTDPATVFYDLALVQLARKDKAAARESLQRALSHEPHHQQSLKLWNSLTSKP
jgi:serine/threonine protein kinase/Flp pilus assembly protein TadD